MDKKIQEQIDAFSKLWHRLLETSRKMDLERLFPNLSELTEHEISIIRIISERPEIILKDICEDLNIPKSTLSNMINRLEKKGYVKRVIGKKDLRSFGLVLTSKGQLTQEEHLKFETLLYGSILESLGNEEKRLHFLELGNEIAENLEKRFQK